MQSASKERSRRYHELNEKYISDADKLFASKDYPQASEKYWGAAAEITKAYGAETGKVLRIHGELRDFVRKLGNKRPELELMTLFVDAEALHANFCENELAPEGVEKYAQSVRTYVSRMRKLMGSISSS
jgi:hypothetical protein